MSDKIRYSELFYSFQGEGMFTGEPTMWLRLFGCNLTCSGFGQMFPTKPETYEGLVIAQDLNHVKRIEDLPSFSRGCDSGYSWHPMMKRLAKEDIPYDIARMMMIHLRDLQVKHLPTHLALTGGEPMLWQKHIPHIVNAWNMLLEEQAGGLTTVTIETNATKAPTNDQLRHYLNTPERVHTVLWSMSPKLYNVSGEKAGVNIAAIADIYANLQQNGDIGQLKFVVNNSQAAWDEMLDVIARLNAEGVDLPIWVMPVGATNENGDLDVQEIVDRTMRWGYNVCIRAHSYVWGSDTGR